MLNVGIVGVGFMGRIHYLAYQQARGWKVTAIATRDPKKRAGDWRNTTGNFGPPGAKFDLGKIACYEGLSELLADPKIDVVDICLPPAQHAAAAVAAFRAGKHVFCEKPIAMTTHEADRMVAAAERSGKQLLVGHVLPYFPEYAFAYKTIRSGKYGRVLGGRFKRIISDPTWLKDFYNPRTVGGPVVDLHIHDAHFIRLVCGMPTAVSSRGRVRGEVVEFVETQFIYTDGGPLVSAVSGVIAQQGRPFTHAYEIYLEKATLLFDFAVLGGQPVVHAPVTVLTNDGKVQQPALGGGELDAFVAEVQEVARSVRTGAPSPLLGGQLARDALVLCHRQTQSVLSGKTVKV